MRAREQFTDMFWLMKKSHPQLHKIMDELHARAKEGDAEAQYNLGVMYINGKGVRQDLTVAKEWFGKSCDNDFQKGCDFYRLLNQR